LRVKIYLDEERTDSEGNFRALKNKDRMTVNMSNLRQHSDF